MDVGGLLEALGNAIAAAAVEGRTDVAAELALIVGRVASEGRELQLAARGVPTLDSKRGKRTPKDA